MTRLLATAPAILLLAGCSNRAPATPSPTRSLSEGAALAVIARAVVEQGETPTAGRDVRLPSGRRLRVDVGLSGHQLGIAYLTPEDVAELDPKADLPPRASGNDLWITQAAGTDADAVILLLDAGDYRYDDGPSPQDDGGPPGPERRLSRDVHDFLVIARKRNLP